jgi:hypothetical protein
LYSTKIPVFPDDFCTLPDILGAFNPFHKLALFLEEFQYLPDQSGSLPDLKTPKFGRKTRINFGHPSIRFTDQLSCANSFGTVCVARALSIQASAGVA